MIRRIDRTALLMAAAGLILALPVLAYPLGRDQGMYANIAQAIRAGGLPFVDMWDVKPPAIYYLYAGGISLFGASTAALRALDFLAVAALLVPLHVLTNAFAGRTAARWAMLLFPVFYFTETFASLTQSDSLVTLPMTWAALCAYAAGRRQAGSRPAVMWAFACGFVCGIVILFKHYYVLFAAALIASHVWTRLRTGPVHVRRITAEGLAFTAGGLLFGLPVLAFFARTGILSEMLTVAQGTSQYNQEALSSPAALWAQLENYVRYRLWHWGPLLALALAGIIPALRRVQGRTLAASLPLFWLIGGLVFVLVQGKGFDTHWLPLLPPLVMLASRSLARMIALAAWPRARAALGVAAFALFGFILAKDTWLVAWPYLTGQQSQHEYYAGFQAGDLNAADSLDMADWLTARTTGSDTVYIWGFRPEVAFMAGLRPATRFQAQFPLVGDRYPAAWKQENVDTLWAAMPPYVVVMRADYMPWVTGSDKDSNTLLAEDYQHLRDWLIENYDRHEERGNFLIWRHKLLSPPSAGG